ncbi:MAG: hypothetical protein GF320_12840, partial [Armatimonadia bacterium]|nr:hypothetical protein [Armatimonadia bacterium]
MPARFETYECDTTVAQWMSVEQDPTDLRRVIPYAGTGNRAVGIVVRVDSDDGRCTVQWDGPLHFPVGAIDALESSTELFAASNGGLSTGPVSVNVDEPHHIGEVIEPYAIQLTPRRTDEGRRQYRTYRCDSSVQPWMTVELDGTDPGACVPYAGTGNQALGIVVSVDRDASRCRVQYEGPLRLPVGTMTAQGAQRELFAAADGGISTGALGNGMTNANHLGAMVTHYTAVLDAPIEWETEGETDAAGFSGSATEVELPSPLLGASNQSAFNVAVTGLLAGDTQIIYVASGTEIDTVAEAMALITDAAEDKWYVVALPPGDNTEDITVKGYVSLIGSGRGPTRLTGTLTLPADNLPCGVHDVTVDATMLATCQEHPLCQWSLIDADGLYRQRTATNLMWELVGMGYDVEVATLKELRVPPDWNGIVLSSVYMWHTGTPNGTSGVT